MKIVAAIPAKGTSKRIPRKNMQKVLGIPLFLWAANNLNRVLPKQDIYIDSDSAEILENAAFFGYNTIKRPAELATNAIDGNQLMLWQASNLDADVIIQHLPPMIFLRKETILNGIQAIKDGYDSAFALMKDALYIWNEDGPLYDLKNIPNSFTLPIIRIESMGFYIARKKVLEETGTRICGKHLPVEIDAFESIDIDNPVDLRMARALANGLDRDSEYTIGIDKYFKKKDIKLLILDVDGVMTDGGMYYSESGDRFKKFNTKDGIAIKRLLKVGIDVRFLSSGTNVNLIKGRAKTLGVTKYYCGLEEKSKILLGWIKELKLIKSEVSYIGDDVNDLEAMQHCDLLACPSDASSEVKDICQIILKKKGGEGCIREFIDGYLLNNE